MFGQAGRVRLLAARLVIPSRGTRLYFLANEGPPGPVPHAETSGPLPHSAESGQPIRALVVSPLPPPLGGIETWTQILVQKGLPPPFEFEVVDTKAFRRHRGAPFRLNPTEVKRNLRILWRIYRSLASGRFSLMHLNCSLSTTGAVRDLVSVLMAGRAGTPCVVNLHGTFRIPPGRGPAARFYRWAYRVMFNRAARILAQGQPSFRSVLQLGGFAHKTYPMMPNFVDVHAIPEASPGSDRHDRLGVIFTGALIEEKGAHTIVEVARRLPGARFKLVGGAPEESRAELLRRIGEYDLEGRVQVIGPLENREVVELLAESDVFLFPTKLHEGFSVSVLEAMAVGLPVAASRMGAIPEMVDVPEGGYLADPDDVDAYVSVLARLRDDPSARQRMGQHNRRKALKEYDYDIVVGRLCGIYSEVVQGRGTTGEGNGGAVLPAPILRSRESTHAVRGLAPPASAEEDGHEMR